jgi:hypothetical protein
MCDWAGWNKQIPRSNLSYRAPMAEEENKLSCLMARLLDGLELFGYLICRPASSTRYGSTAWKCGGLFTGHRRPQRIFRYIKSRHHRWDSEAACPYPSPHAAIFADPESGVRRAALT